MNSRWRRDAVDGFVVMGAGGGWVVRKSEVEERKRRKEKRAERLGLIRAPPPHQNCPVSKA